MKKTTLASLALSASWVAIAAGIFFGPPWLRITLAIFVAVYFAIGAALSMVMYAVTVHVRSIEPGGFAREVQDIFHQKPSWQLTLRIHLLAVLDWPVSTWPVLVFLFRKA